MLTVADSTISSLIIVVLWCGRRQTLKDTNFVPRWRGGGVTIGVICANRWLLSKSNSTKVLLYMPVLTGLLVYENSVYMVSIFDTLSLNAIVPLDRPL